MDNLSEELIVETDKLNFLKIKKNSYLLSLNEIYELHDEDENISADDIESDIIGGDIILEWKDSRDYDYLNYQIGMQSQLISILKNSKKKNNVHEINSLMYTLEQIRNDISEDINKAQILIEHINDIIRIFDKK